MPSILPPTITITIIINPSDLNRREQNADLWVYPMEKDVELRGENHLTVYRFGRKVGGHAFCSTCGVPVVNKLRPQSEGEAGAVIAGRLPINVRTINGIDLNALPVNKADGKNLMGDPYEV